MRTKDQILLENAYTKVLKENIDFGDNFDYPPEILRLAKQMGKHPEEVWRKGGDDEYQSQPKFKERAEGDEFTDNKGIKRIMIRMKDGKLIPAEKVFTSKKDGRQWERFKKPDGKVSIKPYVPPAPEPKPEPKPNPFRTEWGSPDADPNWD